MDYFFIRRIMKNYFPNEVKTVQKHSESGEEEGLQLKDSMREYLKKYILKMWEEN